MVGSKKGTVFDRRAQENFYLSILIDLGVTYKRTLGEDPARNFFQQHDIPHELITRILETETPRRLTEWEASAMRVELTRKLETTRAGDTIGWSLPHHKTQKS